MRYAILVGNPLKRRYLQKEIYTEIFTKGDVYKRRYLQTEIFTKGDVYKRRCLQTEVFKRGYLQKWAVGRILILLGNWTTPPSTVSCCLAGRFGRTNG